jgi:hypothetical protein
VIDTAHNAYEISLAEDVIRSAMHPADQFEAFAKLHGKEGMSVRHQQTQNPIGLGHSGQICRGT